MQKKYSTVFTVIFIFVFSLALVSAEKEITDKNWNTHPKIIEVRKLYNDIEEALLKKRITKMKDVMQKEERGFNETYILYADSENVIRKVVVERGSDDSSIITSHYYDAKKNLRFVFIKAGAVNGASLEQRIYFDAGSNRIWEMRKYLSKEKYTFPESWPQDWLVYDPISKFTEQ
jgi:hypothetical protein